MQKAAFYISLLLLAVSCVNEKADPIPQIPAIANLYPNEQISTRSDSQDTTLIKFTYNAANQLIREDSYKNRIPEGFTLYLYNPAGKQIQKTVYRPDGTIYEQDEITYTAQNVPVKLRHSMAHNTGNLHLHHFENYTFNRNGEISEIVRFWPQNTLRDRSIYHYTSNNFRKATLFDENNLFSTYFEVQADGKQNPFYALNRDVIKLPGNDLSIVYKDQNGNVTFKASSTISYNPEGYPLKIIKTPSDGIVLTNTFSYRQ